jgi:hypothetical protein
MRLHRRMDRGRRREQSVSRRTAIVRRLRGWPLAQGSARCSPSPQREALLAIDHAWCASGDTLRSSAVAPPLREAVWLRKGCRSSARQRAWESRLTHIGVRRQVGIARWRIAARRSTSAEDGPDSRPQNPNTGSPPVRLGAASAPLPLHGGLPRLLGMLFLPRVDPWVVVVTREDPPEDAEPRLAAPAVGVAIAP